MPLFTNCTAPHKPLLNQSGIQHACDHNFGKFSFSKENQQCFVFTPNGYSEMDDYVKSVGSRLQKKQTLQLVITKIQSLNWMLGSSRFLFGLLSKWEEAMSQKIQSCYFVMCLNASPKSSLVYIYIPLIT